MKNDVIRDVVFRTNGELYIGVVGSVRSGKSTFIRKFIETKVSPYVNDEELKNKLTDDLPQSSDGKTIMTVEPKFVPSNPVYISVDEEINLNVRLVDCVGYVIPSAKGYINEDGTPRLVKTPWKLESIPFEEAAALGTRKVMENHSHIGILFTSDGSFGEFSRKEYELVEEKLVDELKELDKPFVIVLNTANPNSPEAINLKEQLIVKYDVNVVAINTLELSEDDIDNILKNALEEFDITKLDLNVPNWIKELDNSLEIKKQFNDVLDNVTLEYRKFKHVDKLRDALKESNLFESVVITELNSGTGDVVIELTCSDDLFNDCLQNLLGDIMNDRSSFIKFIQESIISNKEYHHYKDALESVKKTGYGISVPQVEEMTLGTPEIIKQSGRYGVKLKAIAPSIHMIRVDVESTFEPIIGSETQSKELIDNLMKDYEADPDSVWKSEMFGRSLDNIVQEGIRGKLSLMPDNIRHKLQTTLTKVVNKGSNNMIAIVI